MTAQSVNPWGPNYKPETVDWAIARHIISIAGVRDPADEIEVVVTPDPARLNRILRSLTMQRINYHISQITNGTVVRAGGNTATGMYFDCEIYYPGLPGDLDMNEVHQQCLENLLEQEAKHTPDTPQGAAIGQAIAAQNTYAAR